MWRLPIALIPLFPSQGEALALLACVGLSNTLVDLGLYTLMARLAPDEVLARVFGLQESLVSLTVGLGALLASLLIDLTSVSIALVVVGALCPILAVAAWGGLRQLDRYIGVLDKEIGLLQTGPMLRPCRCRPSSTSLAASSQSTCPPAGRYFDRATPPIASMSLRWARRM
jgi:hypothetical protein